MINGVYVQNEDGICLCRVDEFSDDLKEIIRTTLASIAYGSYQVQSGLEYFSYRNTLKGFWQRYSDKAEDTKKGMIGELLAHILIPIIYVQMKRVSILFNKEERSIKKGFDIVYCDIGEQDIWYSEVKSGHRSQNDDCNVATHTLLERAYYDLKDRLSNEERKQEAFWTNALIDVNLSLPESERANVRELLSEQSPIIQKKVISEDKNALLTSVLYEPPERPITIDTLKDFSNSTKLRGSFNAVIVFSIQKHTFEKVASFLESEKDG